MIADLFGLWQAEGDLMLSEDGLLRFCGIDDANRGVILVFISLSETWFFNHRLRFIILYPYGMGGVDLYQLRFFM